MKANITLKSPSGARTPLPGQLSQATIADGERGLDVVKKPERQHLISRFQLVEERHYWLAMLLTLLTAFT